MNQEQQQGPKRSEISGISAQSIETDIMLFKDEVLRDIKKAELQMKAKIEKNNIENEKRTKAVEAKVDLLMKEVTNIMSSASSDKNKMDEISKLIAFKQDTNEKLVQLEYNVNSATRDISNACYRYDKLISNNILISGLIGDNCKYPNMKELLQNVLIQLSSLNSFKDKQVIDLKSYKEKLERLMTTFNRSIDSVKANFTDQCKEAVDECEKNFTAKLELTDQLVEDLRLENSTYSLELKKESQQCKVDFEKLLSMKEEIYKQFNDKIVEYRIESKATSEDFNKFQNEFAVIKLKFTELSEFIKDIRFRRNAKQEILKRDTNEMSKKINFDLKSTKKHIDDKKLKDCILNNKTITHDKEQTLSKHDSYSKKDLSNESPFYGTKDTREEFEDEILAQHNLNELTEGSKDNKPKEDNSVIKPKIRTKRISAIINAPPLKKKDIEEVKIKRNSLPQGVGVLDNDQNNNLELSLLNNNTNIDQGQINNKKEKAKTELKQEENAVIFNMEIKEPSSPQQTKRIKKNCISPPHYSPKKITIRDNQQLLPFPSPSPIPFRDNTTLSKDSIDGINQLDLKNTVKINEIKQTQEQQPQINANVIENIKQNIYLNQNLLKESNKPNTLATASPESLTTLNQDIEEEASDQFDIKPQSRNQQIDEPQISAKPIPHKKNALSQNPSRTQKVFYRSNIKSKVNNLYLTSFVPERPSASENVKEISDRLFITEMRMKKLDINMKEMIRYLKTYIIRLEGKYSKHYNSNPSTKLQLVSNPAGLFVPFNFDENNIEDYFPENTNRKTYIGLHSKSQDERKKFPKEASSLYNRKQPLPFKVSTQLKPLSDDFKQTFSALSVIFTNKPKPYTSREQEG